MCKPGILQQNVSSSKAREKIETSDRLKCIKQTCPGPNFQNRNGRGTQKYHLHRGWVSLARFNRHVLSHLHTHKIAKSSKISCDRPVVPVLDTSFWYCYGTSRVHPCCKRNKNHASKQWNLHSSVPGQLVKMCSITANLLEAVETISSICSGTRLGGKLSKVRTNPTSTNQYFLSYSFNLSKGEVSPDRKKVECFKQV